MVGGIGIANLIQFQLWRFDSLSARWLTVRLVPLASSSTLIPTSCHLILGAPRAVFTVAQVDGAHACSSSRDYPMCRRPITIGVYETRYAGNAALRQPTITATIRQNNSVGHLSFRSI